MLMTMMLVENHFKPLRPVMDPHDLEELLRQIALGSQQAFEELYRATDSEGIECSIIVPHFRR